MSTTYASTVQSITGLQAYYRLNETSGTVAHDSTSNNYSATISGATYGQSGALLSETDTAMSFTASGGLVFPPSLNIDTWSAASLLFWINLGAGWQFVAITTNASATLYYLNGSNVTPGAGGSVLLDQLLGFAGTLLVSGTLDEVAIYNTVLSPSQVALLYTVALTAPVTSTTLSAGGYSVTIGGNPVFVEAGSLTVDQKIGKTAQASLTAYTTDGMTHFQDKAPVVITDTLGNTAFTGYLDAPYEEPRGYQQSLEHTLTCIDQTWLAQKRIVAASYVNKTIGYMVKDIYNNILAAEGVTIGMIYDGIYPSTTLYPSPTLYPTGNVGLIPSANFAYCSVSDAYDALAQEASVAGVPYFWTIDQNKVLWFVPYTTTVNPIVVDGSQIEMVNNPPKVTRSNPTYRNTQYITGGVAQTVQQNETRVGDGNTVAWTMGYQLSSAPTVKVNGATQTVGIKGVQTGYNFYWAQGDATITQDSGGTKLTSSQTLSVSYIGQYPTVITAQNGAQIAYQASIDGTSGIVEVAQQDQTITSAGNGLNEASQLLTRYAVQGIQLVFYTLTSGFAPGQLITVNLPRHGLYNLQMLIEEVSASDQQDGLNYWYCVSAVSGPYDTTWQDFFAKRLKQPQVPNSINVGVSQSVTLLANFTSTLTPTATLNVSVLTALLPSSTLYPSTTLYPA